MLKRAHKIALFAVLLVTVGAGAWIASARLQGPGPREVALSDAVAQLRAGAVTKAWVDDTDSTVTLETRSGRLVASYPDGYSGDLTRQALGGQGRRRGHRARRERSGGPVADERAPGGPRPRVAALPREERAR